MKKNWNFLLLILGVRKYAKSIENYYLYFFCDWWERDSINVWFVNGIWSGPGGFCLKNCPHETLREEEKNKRRFLQWSSLFLRLLSNLRCFKRFLRNTSMKKPHDLPQRAEKLAKLKQFMGDIEVGSHKLHQNLLVLSYWSLLKTYFTPLHQLHWKFS